MIIMPNIPFCVFAMLACARIGATFAVIDTKTKAPDLYLRLDDFLPKMILLCTSGYNDKGKNENYSPILDKALRLNDKLHLLD